MIVWTLSFCIAGLFLFNVLMVLAIKNTNERLDRATLCIRRLEKLVPPTGEHTGDSDVD